MHLFLTDCQESTNHIHMKKTLVLFLLFIGFLSAHAQEGAVPKLENPSTPGSGKVSVVQDPRLSDMINGRASHRFDEEASTGRHERVPLVPERKRVMKTKGFRIQVFWGGSERTEQSKARAAGNKVTSLFPELQAYTSYESPHWRCRVGDFSDREEAQKYLNKIRKANLANGAMIVKSEIILRQ